MDNNILIEKQLEDYEYFLGNIGMNTSQDVNKAIYENRINELINISEERSRNMIKQCCEDILKRSDCKLILETGPSSSGKTTFAQRLCENLEKCGMSVLIISLDDYYKPLDEIPLGRDGKPDLEDIEAFEYDVLNEDLANLISGQSVYMPFYDFEKRKKIRKGKLISLKDDELILVEGIQAFNPKIAKDINVNQKYKIYCSALNSLKNKTEEE